MINLLGLTVFGSGIWDLAFTLKYKAIAGEIGVLDWESEFVEK